MPELAQATAFEIRALQGVGDLVHVGDRFDLVGRALPFRGVKFEVVQRIQTTWYPGNPVAVQQPMGATETNTTINGAWRERYLGDVTDPGGAALARAFSRGSLQLVGPGVIRQLVDNFELLVRYAVPVEVRWGAGVAEDGSPTGAAIVRRGLIKRFAHTWDRPQDLTWEMEFEWRGREDDAAKPVALRFTDAADQLRGVSDQIDGVREAMAEFREKANALMFGLPGAFDAAMDDVATSLGRMNEAITDVVAGVVGGIHADGGVLDHGNALMSIALLRGSVDAIRRGVEELEALPLYALSVRDDALDLLSEVSALLSLKQKMSLAQEFATGVADDLAGQTFQGVLAEVQASGGTDLRDLALRYYGDPDLWFTIASYNGLSSSRVPDNPDGPSDQRVLTIKIPRQDGTVTQPGSVC